MGSLLIIDFFAFNVLMLLFAVLIVSSYILLAIVSVRSLIRYLKSNEFVDYSVLLSTELAPALSLIAPAYNEGLTIEENIQSLLSLNYNNFEIIVVNDGSKDNSMEVLIKAFQLEIVHRNFNNFIETKPIRGVYKSRNAAYKKLIVVDKVNGGKADALNTGINVSSHPYVVCIDVDCVLDKDTLLKLSKPFLEQSKKRIIATGGVVRIANSCIVKRGRLMQVNAPENLLPRTQVIEYLRAFLLGRMAWSRLDGLLLISGAFGMFDREIAIKAGGYDHKTVGEDMELVVRMRRYMLEHNLPYSVAYIPDPLCWTEAPESLSIFRRQRSRWTRGTMETLWIHRRMFLNPKYKILGLLSLPYWFVFEYLAPIIELLGLLVTLLFIVLGIISWKFFSLLVLFVYTFAVMFSFLALLTEEFTYHQYPKISDFRKFALTALIEPFYFHPFSVYAALRGNWEKIKGTKGWGDMTRKGFTKTKV
ncbi:MAG: glycosyltransferase [Bacteroidota bacterium]